MRSFEHGEPMNYLAHLFCSEDTPDSLLGNCIADLVKGRMDSRIPSSVAEGIMHHRKTDQYTDAHTVFRSSRRLISDARRRYSGVIIDILYDHFLSTGWDRYSSVRLDAFVERTYGILSGQVGRLPGPMRLVVERLVREDWLRCYRTVEGIDRTFWRISLRLRRSNELQTAVEELENNYVELHGHFHCFFPDLISHVCA